MNDAHLRRQAAAWGGALGAGLALALGLLADLPADAVARRTALLGLAGGWIGLLLGWLHDLLPPPGGQRDDASKDARA